MIATRVGAGVDQLFCGQGSLEVVEWSVDIGAWVRQASLCRGRKIGLKNKQEHDLQGFAWDLPSLPPLSQTALPANIFMPDVYCKIVQS